MDDPLPPTSLSSGAGDMPLAMAYTLAYFIVGSVFYHLAPHIQAVYAENRIDPPEVTRAVLSFAHWFRDDYGWLWLLPVPIGLPLALVNLGSKGRRSEPRRRWRPVHLSSILLLAAAILVVASLVLPLTTMAPDFSHH